MLCFKSELSPPAWRVRQTGTRPESVMLPRWPETWLRQRVRWRSSMESRRLRTIILGSSRFARVVGCQLRLDLLNFLMVADLGSQLQLLLQCLLLAQAVEFAHKAHVLDECCACRALGAVALRSKLAPALILQVFEADGRLEQQEEARLSPCRAKCGTRTCLTWPSPPCCAARAASMACQRLRL